MANKEPKRKIKIKNYIILALLFIAGIGLTLYLCELYKVYDEYQKQTPVIRDTLSEIKYEDLEHYILDNPTTMIYMCTSSDMICRNYEKDFKKLIESKELQDKIIYLNLSNANKEEFVEDFNKKYQYKIKLTSKYPAIVVFEEGKISNLLQGDAEKKLTVVKTKQFIELNKIGE